ncbi:MAG TPA: RDD family protein [Burkholderiales bacterium]|nr:RDD family protein [Burkholderiales bacterium]
MVDTREPTYAGFWLRLGASVIDVLVLLAIIAPIEIAFYGREYPALAMAGRTLAVDFWTQLVLPLLAMIVLWRYRSATPGLMLLSAKIVDATTLARAKIGKLTLRAVVLLLMWMFVLPLIGVLWIAFDRRKQGWHDKAAGTVVIRDTKEET